MLYTKDPHPTPHPLRSALLVAHAKYFLAYNSVRTSEFVTHLSFRRRFRIIHAHADTPPVVSQMTSVGQAARDYSCC